MGVVVEVFLVCVAIVGLQEIERSSRPELLLQSFQGGRKLIPCQVLEEVAAQIGHGRFRLGAIGAAGAPGANLDEACARAGLDKIRDRLK